MQAIKYKDLSDAYDAVTIEAGKTIQANFPDIDLEHQVILVNGKQATPDHIVKEGDIVVLRSIPGSSAVLVVMFAVAIIGAVYTGYQAYKMRKQVEAMQEAMSRSNENVVSTPMLRGAQNQSAENRFLPYFIGRNFFTPYKLIDQWKQIPVSRAESIGLSGGLRTDEINTFILECGYQKLLFESINVDDVRLKTFADTTPQEGVVTYDTGFPFTTWWAPVIEIRQATSGNFTTADFNKGMMHTDLGIELKKADDLNYEDVILTLPRFSMGAKICMVFSGLRQYTDEGDKKPRELTFKAEISYDGGDTWDYSKVFVPEDDTSIGGFGYDGTFKVKQNTKYEFYRTLKCNPGYAKVKNLASPVMLRISCLTNTYDGSALDTVNVAWMTNELYNPDKSLAANNFVKETILDDTEKWKSTLLGIQLMANQGLVEKLTKINIIASGVARKWNGSAWSTGRYKTSNPAAWLLEVLTTTVHSPSACLDAELDLDAFGELYEYCETNSLECNMIILEGDTKENILKKICATCFASLYRAYNGKISVVYDDVRENAIAIFNTQNCMSFRNRKDMTSTVTDGIRVSYIEADTWEQDAALVMRPGKTRDGTSIIRDMSIEGVTNYDQAVFIARRIMAQDLYRQKETTVRVGKEGAFYTPLAKVLVQHPSLKIGLGSAEIQAVVMSGTNMTGLVLYEPVEYQSSYSDGYGMIIQCISDTYCTPIAKQYTAIADGMAKEIVFSTPINTLTAPAIPHAGDILSYGYLDDGSFDTITSPMLITGIDRDDTGYVLSLVDYNEDIYTTGEYPVYTPNITQPTARGFTKVTTVPTIEDVIQKIDEAKSPITVSGIPIYESRLTCRANCEIDGVDYLLYDTASGWEVVSINEDESFTSVLTGTGTMYDMCAHNGVIFLAGSTGAWFINEDNALTIIYDSAVTSIQSDGANLWGVVGGQVCKFGGAEGGLVVHTAPEVGYSYRDAFSYDGDVYCFGNGSSSHIMYKLVGGSFTAVYTDPTSRYIYTPTICNGDLYVILGPDGTYKWNGSGFDLISANTNLLICEYNGDIICSSSETINSLNVTTGSVTLYATLDYYYARKSGCVYNGSLVMAVSARGASTDPIYIFNLPDATGAVVQMPILVLSSGVPFLYTYGGLLRQIRGRAEWVISEDLTGYTLITSTADQVLSAYFSGTGYTLSRFEYNDPDPSNYYIEITYPYGTPTPIDETVRNYTKLRLLADTLYVAVSDGHIYKIQDNALVQHTQTGSGYNALAWRKDKVYAATDSAVYLVNADGTVSAVENATSATDIVELFVSGDYLIWCPTRATAGTLYAAFVEYTGSVNVYQDITLTIPADFPIGATKTFRKMSAYSGTPVQISPPSGATFDGRSSISLYGQYSFVELERISSTVFAIKDFRDYYAAGEGITVVKDKRTMLIRDASIAITPVANTPTSAPFTFPENFARTPTAQITMVTSVPGSIVVGASCSNITNSGFLVWVYRTNTTTTGISVLAVGEWY